MTTESYNYIKTSPQLLVLNSIEHFLNDIDCETRLIKVLSEAVF